MKPLFWTIAFAALTSLGVTGCQSGGGLGAAVVRAETMSDTSDDTLSRDSTVATVRIENSGFATLTVYALADGGMQQRIGMADPATTTVIVIPKHMVQNGRELQFLLRPFGSSGREELSSKIQVYPGDEIILTVMP